MLTSSPVTRTCRTARDAPLLEGHGRSEGSIRRLNPPLIATVGAGGRGSLTLMNTCKIPTRGRIVAGLLLSAGLGGIAAASAAAAGPRYPLPGYDDVAQVPAARPAPAPVPAPSPANVLPAASGHPMAAQPSAVPTVAANPAVAVAYAPAAAAPQPSIEEVVRRFVESAVADTGRVQIQVGRIDPRLHLAPCGRVEPFLPAGSRLWGRGAVGVRCVEGANWTATMPVNVMVFGNALVAANNLTAQTPLSAGDFRLEEVELTRESGQPVQDAAQLVGRSLMRPMTVGQVLKTDYLRVQQTVSAGDQVKIQVIGDGFVVSADGIAMMAGGNGQMLRVRLDNGRILSGTVRDHTIEVRP